MIRPDEVLPELLAPAGGPSALRAAVAGGANAVYLGVNQLNARRGAENFTIETLQVACEFAHLRGVSVYLTANVIILPHEMDAALDLIDSAWAAGVDGVIIQDLGLMRLVRQHLPNVRVHVSTQVNAHASSTLRALSRMGASRVTIARETSIPRIKTLAAAGEGMGLEVESFVHGALCVCYSGQCLLSSLIGGRSANRGLCAQPCRMVYELIDEAGEVLETPGAHLLSPKDLAGISELPLFIDARVASLKIEGRMKSAEYVAIVTGVYRAALDRAAAAPDAFDVRDGEWAVLSEAFSRGFTTAYLTGERGNSMMSYKRPNNRGVLAGRIGAVTDGFARVTLDVALSSDDIIEVWTGRGRFAQAAGALEFNGETHDAVPRGSVVRLRLEGPASTGDRVFRVRNADLLSAAARTFQGEEPHPVEVDSAVRLVVGEPLVVMVTLPDGLSASATGGIAEPARSRPVSAEDVIEHVGRFGGSGFVPREWDVALSPGVGVGYSELHRVRRDALAALRRLMLQPWAGRERSGFSLSVPETGTSTQRGRQHARFGRPKVVAVVCDRDAALQCLAAGADEAHVPSYALDETAPEGIVPVLSRICPDSQESRELRFAQSGRMIVAGTLGLVARAHEAGAVVQAHWSLNAVNAWTVAELGDVGASFVWLSPELSSRQIAEVASRAVVPVGIAVAGRQEVMVAEHCVLMAAGECDRACVACERRSIAHRLRDRKGYEFPVRTDAHGRTHVFNSVPLDLTDSLGEVVQTGVAALRLDLETATAVDAVAQVTRVVAALARVHTPETGRARDRSESTSGHFFRGVQ